MTTFTAPGAFFSSPDFDFEARGALGAAATGIGDTGLVLSTLDRVTDGDHRSWFDAWTNTAATLAKQAADADRGGHRRTAQWAWLAGAEYYAKALTAVDGLPDDSPLNPTFAEQDRCWQAFVDAARGAFVRVPVPYEGAALPGYLLRPDDSGMPRPTLVITNGSDGSLPGLWAYGAGEGLQRGWNVFVYDGPGQQSMLFQRGTAFRPDWEAVLTPVLDTLVRRPDVDQSALLGLGISQGGFWLPRALTAEHRMLAAVADGGVVDIARTWNANLPAELLDLVRTGDRRDFDAAVAGAPSNPDAERTFAFRARPYGISDMFDLFTEIQRYVLTAEDAAKIRTPLLITDPADDQFFAGQPQELYELLRGDRDLLPFSRDTGGNGHCEPLARRRATQATLDYLQDHLPRSG
jgi:hypothetical protein